MGGKCGLIGAAPTGMEVSLDMQTILNGRTIMGIVEGDSIPDVFIPRLIDFYKAGRFPIEKMVTFYPFDQINQAAKGELGEGEGPEGGLASIAGWRYCVRQQKIAGY